MQLERYNRDLGIGTGVEGSNEGGDRCHRHADSSGESIVSEIIQGECGL